MMDLLNIDNHLKTLAFKKIKRILYEHYPKFANAYKKQPNRLDLWQFLVLLYDCVPNIKHVWSIDRLFKNPNILKSGTGKKILNLQLEMNLKIYWLSRKVLNSGKH